nr:peptidase C48, SUMO/sentrin/Ubl1 [Tanacetum cinerariifolium]
MPTKLRCWVGENFDPDKCIIRMEDGTCILITPKMISDMIGIPIGSIGVTEVPAATIEFPLIVEWRKSYDLDDEMFTIKCVLLYLNATISEQVDVEEEIPFMKSWDTMKLKRRENEELKIGGFDRLHVKEAYRYVEPQITKRLTKGKIRSMKNSPAKDQRDITRHVCSLKFNLEDGVFGIAEETNKIEEIKIFQKKKAE